MPASRTERSSKATTASVYQIPTANRKPAAPVQEPALEVPNLLDDFQDAMAEDFDYRGNFFHSKVLTVAPSPCLAVEGIGIVGLPLSPRDGQLLSKLASPDFKIDAPKIHCLNPDWEKYLTSSVLPEACKTLALQPECIVPACKLRCLSVNGPLPSSADVSMTHSQASGSLPQDNCFATLAVVLPSASAGAQLRLAYKSQTSTQPLGQNPLIETSIHAWYSEVAHHLSLTTTGYQITLWYDLIHNNFRFSIPRPLTETHARSELRAVLRRWKLGGYDDEDFIPKKLVWIATSDDDLAELSQEQGFRVFQGKLEYTQEGKSTINRFVTDCYASDHDMDDHNEYLLRKTGIEVERTEITVSELRDLMGNEIPGYMTIEPDEFAPEDEFEDEEPDQRYCDDFVQGEIDLQFSWSRKIMLLIHPDYETEVLSEVLPLPSVYSLLL